jgi:hypothetical protein
MKDKFLNIFGKFKVFSTLSVLLFTFFTIEPVKADFNNLVPCKESPAFQKRLTSSVKKLENRLKLYTPESKETLSLNKQIATTKARFERYGNSNLLCGKEGLPRIIASGQWDHANDFVVPGILFIYITGWSGWVGRKYIRYATTNNVCNEKLYDLAMCFLHQEAYDKLKKAQQIADEMGYKIKIFDAFRPFSVQQKMFDYFNKPEFAGFVSDPKIGVVSHCRGVAVDLTLCHKNGEELNMDSYFDDFSSSASHFYQNISLPAKQNRLIF